MLCADFLASHEQRLNQYDSLTFLKSIPVSNLVVSGNRQMEWRLTSVDNLGCSVSQAIFGMIGTAMIGRT